jgi:hypothetical protein
MGKRRRVRGRKRPSALGKKGTPVTTPMSYERRLASYGIRDLATGAVTGVQTPAQRSRILHKIGHASRQQTAIMDKLGHA